jgi:DNA-binding response OmpR family regulator
VNNENKTGARILLVEDDFATAELLNEVLTDAGHLVVTTSSAEAARQQLRGANAPDLVILDLVLPDMDGLVFLAYVRYRYRIPVIVCSATRRKQDLVLAFKLGADDVITKPFDLDEFLARTRAVLRRSTPRVAGAQPSEGASAATLDQRWEGRPLSAARSVPPPREDTTAGIERIGNVVVDHNRHEVRAGSKYLRLTPTEYRLLRSLLQRPYEVQSRRELARGIWGFENVSAGRTIDVHIRRLRVKLAALAADSVEIISVRGAGYGLVQIHRHEGASGSAENDAELPINGMSA